ADSAKKRKPLGAESTPAGRAGRAEAAESRQEDADRPDAKADTKDSKKSGPSPENPLKFDAADAYLRVRKIVSTTGDTGNLEITPGGDRVLYSASQDGASGLYSVDYAGRERKAVVSGGASGVRCNLAGDKVMYITGGGF